MAECETEKVDVNVDVGDFDKEVEGVNVFVPVRLCVKVAVKVGWTMLIVG